MCLWNCFPWDVMPLNVTVLTGLKSLSSRKESVVGSRSTVEQYNLSVLLHACTHGPSLPLSSSLWLAFHLVSCSHSVSCGRYRWLLFLFLQNIFSLYLLFTIIYPLYSHHDYHHVHIRWKIHLFSFISFFNLKNVFIKKQETRSTVMWTTSSRILQAGILSWKQFICFRLRNSDT